MLCCVAKNRGFVSVFRVVPKGHVEKKREESEREERGEKEEMKMNRIG